MDWSNVLGIAVAVIVYGISFQVILWVMGYELKPKLKYKFVCPVCDFQISGSDRETVTRIQYGHQHHEIRATE